MSNKVVKLTEKQLIDTISKIVNESKEFKEGPDYWERKIIVDDVINRITEFGYDYVNKLTKLNNQFEPTKLKRTSFLK